MAAATSAGFTGKGMACTLSSGMQAFSATCYKPVADIAYAEILEAYGQADFEAELDNFLDFLDGGVLENELADGAEGNLFAVEFMVGFLEDGEAVVDGVGRSKAAALEAKARKQYVGL